MIFAGAAPTPIWYATLNDLGHPPLGTIFDPAVEPLAEWRIDRDMSSDDVRRRGLAVIARWLLHYIDAPTEALSDADGLIAHMAQHDLLTFLRGDLNAYIEGARGGSNE